MNSDVIERRKAKFELVFIYSLGEKKSLIEVKNVRFSIVYYDVCCSNSVSSDSNEWESIDFHWSVFQKISRLDFNETESNEPVVIYNSNNETTVNGTDSITNQFAETVVDLLLDLLEKANLSRTISVIHNETELSELVEQDVDSTPITATTVRLIDP